MGNISVHQRQKLQSMRLVAVLPQILILRPKGQYRERKTPELAGRLGRLPLAVTRASKNAAE